MIQNNLQQLVRYYSAKNRWWIPCLAGGFYSFALPPFNHEFHPLFTLFPLLGFAVLTPLCAFAVQPSLKRAVAHVFLFGFTAALGQYYWLVFDKVEGLWAIVLVGLVAISVIVACFYFAAGMMFRVVATAFPRAYILLFPAVWVLIDYSRTLGEIAFPWAFLGYSLAPLGPLAQLASVTGVWGLTYLLVAGNMLVWAFLKRSFQSASGARQVRAIAIFAAMLAAASIAGGIRMYRHGGAADAETIKLSLLQSNIDVLNWGNRSLEASFEVNEALVAAASRERPDCMILPESALLCFVSHRSEYRTRVEAWVRKTRIPLVFGAIDWESAPSGSYYERFVFNAAFFADTTPRAALRPYHKIKLVPFSEGIPFEASFPILSRVNLGEADFHEGNERVVFTIGGDVKMAPFICYESNFPDFVRERVRRGVNLMVNITNDGWFGKSSGPYHHAMMARMRSIENGVTLARCANSGISMFVDPLGRVIAQTGLYERVILTRTVPRYTIPTLYTKWGDWFVWACGVIIAAGAATALFTRLRHAPKARNRKERTRGQMSEIRKKISTLKNADNSD